MRTTIDSAGRVVIPKAIRAELALTSGQAVDIVVRDGWLEIAPAPTPMHLADEGDGVVAVAEEPMPELTVELVRDVLEHSRR